MGASRLRRHLRNLLTLGCIAAAQGQVTPEMVKIPSGECPIGATMSHVGPDEGDHHATIPAFQLSKYPITNQEYKLFVDGSGHAPPKASFGGKQGLWTGAAFPAEIARQPVVNVNWQDAADYCAWLSKETGKTYRL